MRTRTGYGLGIGVASLAMVVAGCTSSKSASEISSSSSSSSSAAAAATAGTPADLAKFYTQRLAWKKCGSVQCAQLTVPIDYAKPDGATIKLAIDKVPANGDRKGSLVVNPGGPGGSGYDYAAAADQIVTSRIRSAYDVVGFDPRGVQRSAPISCVDDSELDTILGSDPTPDTVPEEQSAATLAKTFGAACQKTSGELLGHVSTVEVAKDLDVLRAALGSEKLDYLGKSYGTFIGSTYAGLFPKRVGQMVLDGVVPPDLTPTQINLGQAEGFEGATRAYMADCVSQGNCPLGDSVDAGMAKLRAFLKALDQNPLPIKSGDVTKLTEGWATLGIAQAMYSKQLWPGLTDAMSAALNGKGDALMALADDYAERNANGTYDGNIMQVINAVNCLDRAASSDLASYQKDAADFSKVAPTWGPMLAWGSLTCGEWPIKATGKPEKITAAGSGPILVVGTTRDPATPYAWSERLASELENGHLLSYDGDGHTAYGQSSCVNDAIDDYLLKGTVPAAGKKC